MNDLSKDDQLHPVAEKTEAPVEEQAGVDLGTPDSETAVAPDRDEAPTKPEAKRPQSAARSRPPRRRAFEDLTPDRQSEITGRREAAAAARQHRYRPAMPTVAEDVELHMPDVILLFEAHFRAVNEYAVALDEVAKVRLHNRQDYNGYLQEFDGYIAELKGLVAGDQETLERASSGGMTASPKPLVKQASIQSNRSMQMLRIFEAADTTLRHASFLSIYGDDAKAFNRSNEKIGSGIKRCVKKLRQVKHRAFRQIIEERQIDVKNHDKLKLADVMAIDESSKKRQRTRSRSRIDPAAAATAPVVSDDADTAEN